LSLERLPDPAQTAAELIAADRHRLGAGPREFGPRALGNRSILADPRPAHYRDLINQMLRSARVSGHSLPQCSRAVAGFFPGRALASLLSIHGHHVPVRPQWRTVLGAVTHVDGSARVQSVAQATNPLFHRLIEAFGRLWGVPSVLNTSFNNNASRREFDR